VNYGLLLVELACYWLMFFSCWNHPISALGALLRFILIIATCLYIIWERVHCYWTRFQLQWIEIHSPEIHEILDFSCSFAIDHSSSHMVRISREKWCLLFCSLSFLPNQVNYDFYIYIITYLFLVQWYIL